MSYYILINLKNIQFIQIPDSNLYAPQGPPLTAIIRKIIKRIDTHAVLNELRNIGDIPDCDAEVASGLQHKGLG